MLYAVVLGIIMLNAVVTGSRDDIIIVMLTIFDGEKFSVSVGPKKRHTQSIKQTNIVYYTET